MKIKKSSNILITLVLIILFYVLESEELENTGKEFCEKEEISGMYSDYCDCGSKNVLILKVNGEAEIVNYDEGKKTISMCSWSLENGFIRLKGQLINLALTIKKNPVKDKTLYLINDPKLKKEIDHKYEKNKSLESVLMCNKVEKDEKVCNADRDFYKTYDIKQFSSLKCEKNKAGFLKRMIYSEKFFSEKEVNVIDFLDKTGKEKIDFNAKDIDGVTALHAAVDCEFVKTVELLLKKGAVPNIKNAQGITPLSLARQNGLKEIEELLKKYGAKD